MENVVTTIIVQRPYKTTKVFTANKIANNSQLLGRYRSFINLLSSTNV